VSSQERSRRPERIQVMVCRLSDTLCSLAAFLLAFKSLAYVRETLHPQSVLYSRVFGAFSPANGPHAVVPGLSELTWILVITTVALLLSLDSRHNVKPLQYRTDGQIMMSLLIAIAIAMGSITTVFYALRVPPYSRLFVFSYLTLLFILAASFRVSLKYLLRMRQKQGFEERAVAIVGRVSGISKLMESADGHFWGSETKLIGCFPIDLPASSEKTAVPRLGSLSDLEQVLVHTPIDEVIIVLPDGECAWLQSAISCCDYFRVSAHILHERMLSLDLQDLRVATGGLYLPFPAVTLAPEEEEQTDTLILKRLIDIFVSATALILLAPLFALIAIAIKLTTPGLPVFYHWGVVGYRGRRFVGYKFTTMVADADDRKQDLQSLNEMSGPVFKIRDDPRVTKLGKFLRKYSVNELPQLWSVLVGDMSLVGPRPAGPHELARYEMWHKRKLSVRPGITCLWQVRGRNAISSFDDWVKMDLEYIEKRSTWFDLTILCRTVGVVVRGTGS
jgi:exopolysaccharide biosynthesis polyprenyl glycosylphosphotransferase